MPRLFLLYPDGVVGFALLVMRLSYAGTAFPAIARLIPEPAALATALSAMLALALAAGLCMRVAALVLAVALAPALFAARGETVFLLLASAGGAGSLMLFGPGAYSVDAHRFGRRVIRLEPRSPDRGGPG